MPILRSKTLDAETESPAHPPASTLGGNTHVNSEHKLLHASSKSLAYPPASILGRNRQVNYAQKVLDAETELPAFTLGRNRHVNSEPVLDSGRELRIFHFS